MIHRILRQRFKRCFFIVVLPVSFLSFVGLGIAVRSPGIFAESFYSRWIAYYIGWSLIDKWPYEKCGNDRDSTSANEEN